MQKRLPRAGWALGIVAEPERARVNVDVDTDTWADDMEGDVPVSQRRISRETSTHLFREASGPASPYAGASDRAFSTERQLWRWWRFLRRQPRFANARQEEAWSGYVSQAVPSRAIRIFQLGPHLMLAREDARETGAGLRQARGFALLQRSRLARQQSRA